MAIHNEILYASLDELCLDSKNPRLGRHVTKEDLDQHQVLELMKDWALDELAVSFLESGFWPQEALLVVKEPSERLVVVEGNRRVAALRFLRDAKDGRPASRKWAELARTTVIPQTLFDRIPYILADSRADVEAFLGFRHVTGIKQWAPAEKAEYIARLIDSGLSYQQVTSRIGSKVDAVRRNYIAYRILLQMEAVEGISLQHVEEKFSVLFLALREGGVQKFLGVNNRAEPAQAEKPVPERKLRRLAEFAEWLFGTDKKPPLFTDSRYVTKFARVLESRDGVAYLQATENPSFELALQKARADEPEMIDRVRRATDELEQVLGRVHLHLDSKDLQRAIERCCRGALELLHKFPGIEQELLGSRE